MGSDRAVDDRCGLVGKEGLGGGGSAILIIAPNKLLRNCGGVPSPSRVSSLIEVSPSALTATADE